MVNSLKIIIKARATDGLILCENSTEEYNNMHQMKQKVKNLLKLPEVN